MALLRSEIEHFSCFTHNPVVEVGDVGKDGVGVVARAHSQACVDHTQKFKNLWINLIGQRGPTVSNTGTGPLLVACTELVPIFQTSKLLAGSVDILSCQVGVLF